MATKSTIASRLATFGFSIVVAGGWVGEALAQYEPKVPANYENVLRASQANSPGATQPRPSIARTKSRWYGGASIGASAFDADLIRSRADLESTGAAAYSISAHPYDGAFKGYLGYWLSGTASIEVAYWNFGGPDYEASVTAPVAAQVSRRFRARAVGASAVYWYPLGQSFTALGRIGAARVSARASELSVPAGLQSLSNDGDRTWNPVIGLGLEYRISDSTSARAEYEYVARIGNPNKFGTADIHLVTLGLRFGF